MTTLCSLFRGPLRTVLALALCLICGLALVLAIGVTPSRIVALLAAAGLAAIGMSFATQHNIGSQIVVLRGSANASLTAGGSGDNSQVTGHILDRSLYNYPLSMVLALMATATLAANKKLTFKTVTIQTSDDSGMANPVSLATPADVDVLVDSGSGSTIYGQQNYDVDLGGAKRYIQILFTPDLNATSVDTAACSSAVVFGGGDTVPV